MIDAQQFDAPTDAPFACPDVGQPPPPFASQLHRNIVQECHDYSVVASGHAVALCADVTGATAIFEGPPDKMLEPADGLPQPTGMVTYKYPRLSPDGTMLLVLELDGTTSGFVRMYTRTSGQAWQRAADPPFTGLVDWVSTIAHGPTGEHVLVYSSFVDAASYHEWVLEAGTWRDATTHPITAFSPSWVSGAELTGDGLRALAQGPGGFLYYTDRADFDAPFRNAVPLMALPSSPDVVMSDDCARIYMTGAGAIWYLQHE